MMKRSLTRTVKKGESNFKMGASVRTIGRGDLIRTTYVQEGYKEVSGIEWDGGLWWVYTREGERYGLWQIAEYGKRIKKN